MTSGTEPNAFATLTHVALLGTDHPGGSRAVDAGDLTALRAGIARDDLPGALLSDAALFALRGLAGRLPAPAVGELAPASPPESEKEPTVPEGLAALLADMLSGVNAEVLPEWLDRVAARGWRAPWIALPALLDLGRKRTTIAEQVTRVLGARGQWLAAQNGDWAYAVAMPTDALSLQSAWEVGTPQERRVLLQRVRERDAALGRGLVESSWAEESPAARVALMEGMRFNVVPEDEPFLERALDDRRQEVRHDAAALLARLPATALVARMMDRARGMLSHSPRKRLHKEQLDVEPPVECDAAMVRDGITSKPQGSEGLGERASWLMQIIGFVPPAEWSDGWNTKPESLIALAKRTEWSAALFAGWTAAAARHRDAEWAEALLRAKVVGAQRSRQVEMLLVLDAGQREALLSEVISEEPAADSTVELLVAVHGVWSVPFGRAILDWLRARFTSAASQGTGLSWRLVQAMTPLALQMPPALMSEARDACHLDPDAPAGLVNAAERFLTLLSFRHALHQELDR